MTNYDKFLDMFDPKWGMYMEDLIEVSGLSRTSVYKYIKLGLRDGFIKRTNMWTETRPRWMYQRKEDHRE